MRGRVPALGNLNQRWHSGSQALPPACEGLAAASNQGCATAVRLVAHPFMVAPGQRVSLAKYDPDFHGEYASKDDLAVVEKLQADLRAVTELQEKLYAEGKQALLIILQGMDAAGKDGTIKHVMAALNPLSCHVVGFKQPTSEELAHDFLWRIHQHAPAKGHIAVFNRSHYEDVIVVRVKGLVSEKLWRGRYEHINAFEKLLADNGTRVVKFFLHISRDEQRRRLQERLADPTKQWKFNPEDLRERERWDEYMAAYEDALSLCSTPWAPWYVVPANHKWYRNLVVADILAQTLRDMNPQYPPPRPDLGRVQIK
ncbi:MAG: polyphosphate kinase 2 family protein [Armatimonadetes bacterium]|nr:polyphosphate kinase 2 family protein [Armatimonadota bacterium]